MGRGTLPVASFGHYLVQDYLFLMHFERAYAQAVYTGQSLDDMHAAFGELKATLDVEMDLHVRLCTGWERFYDITHTNVARNCHCFIRRMMSSAFFVPKFNSQNFFFLFSKRPCESFR